MYEVKVMCDTENTARVFIDNYYHTFLNLMRGYKIRKLYSSESTEIIFECTDFDMELDDHKLGMYIFNLELKNERIESIYVPVTIPGIHIRILTDRGGNDMPPKGIREEELFMMPLTNPVRFDYARVSVPSMCVTPVERKFMIDKVIFNGPATIVYWKDGTKTVVKCMEGDTFSKETGLAMAYMKKLHGNDNTFHKIFKEWC